MISATKMVVLLWMAIAVLMMFYAVHMDREAKAGLDRAEELLDAADEHLRHAAKLRKEAEEYRDKCRAAYLAAEGAAEEKGE